MAFAILLSLSLVLASCSDVADDTVSATTAASVASADEPATYLMVQNAASAALGEADGGYVLTLTGVDPTTVWFADRPDRGAGTQSTAAVLDAMYADDQNQGPPNAALIWPEDGGAVQTLALELNSGTYDEAAGTIVYETTVLEEKSGRLARFDDNAEPPKGRIAAVSLFIDNSILRWEQCYANVLNALNNPPGVYGATPTTLQVWMVDTDFGPLAGQTRTDSGPSQGHTFSYNETVDWHWQADSSTDACEAWVQFTIWQSEDSAVILEFRMINPSIGSNSEHILTCHSDYTCVAKTVENGTTLSTGYAACHAGVSDSSLNHTILTILFTSHIDLINVAKSMSTYHLLFCFFHRHYSLICS